MISVLSLTGKSIYFILSCLSSLNYNYILFPIFILSAHWVGVRFYSEFCVPPDFYGYLVSYFTVASPVCIYVLQIVEKTSNIYNVLWGSFTLWTCSVFVSSYKRMLNK